MAKTNNNIPAKDWHDYRRSCDRLRESGPDGNTLYGWNALSKAFGHSERGFAQAAYDNKHVCTPEVVKDARRLVESEIEKGNLPAKPPRKTSPKHPPALKGTPTDEALAFVNAFDELRETFGGSTVQIKDALGTSTYQVAYYKIKKGEQFDVKGDTLSDLLVLLRRCRRGDVPWFDAVENDGDREDPKKVPVAEEVAAADDADGLDEGRLETLPEVQDRLLALGAIVDEHVEEVVAALGALRDAAPPILRSGYNDGIERLREAKGTFEDLYNIFG